jgi:hypothetical protein
MLSNRPSEPSLQVKELLAYVDPPSVQLLAGVQLPEQAGAIHSATWGYHELNELVNVPKSCPRNPLANFTKSDKVCMAASGLSKEELITGGVVPVKSTEDVPCPVISQVPSGIACVLPLYGQDAEQS